MSHIVYKTYFWANFGQKWALAPLQELAQHHEQYENVVFLVSRHDGNKKLEDLHKNMMLGRKQQFWAKKEPLRAIGAEKQPFFGPKKGPDAPPETTLQCGQHKKVVF